VAAGSVAVGTAAREDAQDVDGAVFAGEADAPVANSEPPFVVAAGEPDDVALGRVGDESVQGGVVMRR